MKKIILFGILFCSLCIQSGAEDFQELKRQAAAGSEDAQIALAEILQENGWNLQILYRSKMIPPNRGTSAASDFEAGLLATALLQQGGAVLSDLALKGNATALYDMMYAYRKGLGVEKDLSLSSSLLHRLLPLLEKGARNGITRDETTLGLIYWKGIGVPKDPSRSEQLFLRAVSQGSTEALGFLGSLYMENSSTRKKGISILIKAAEKGDLKSQKALGLIYHFGQYGIPRDPALSKQWLQQAQTSGDLLSGILLHMNPSEDSPVLIPSQKEGALAPQTVK